MSPSPRHIARHASHGHPAAPRPAEPDLRASDDERELTVEALRGHASAGRLDPDELDERLGGALGARSRADLAALLADLPAPRAPRTVAARPHRHHHHRKDPRAFIAIAALLLVIWAVTGMGYFWPVWPLLWFAFAGARRWRWGNTRVIGNTTYTQ